MALPATLHNSIIVPKSLSLRKTPPAVSSPEDRRRRQPKFSQYQRPMLIGAGTRNPTCSIFMIVPFAPYRPDTFEGDDTFSSGYNNSKKPFFPRPQHDGTVLDTVRVNSPVDVRDA